VSDATGVFEAIVFSEALARARDVLEEGETLLLKVTVERQEEQLRFMVQDIQSLDKSLSGKIREVRVVLDSGDAVKKMKDLLIAEGPGPARIVVEISLNDRESAIVTLPESYSFSPQMRSQLGKTAGVLDVREL
jgi:DNA polymerase III subunit alpha